MPMPLTDLNNSKLLALTYLPKYEMTCDDGHFKTDKLTTRVYVTDEEASYLGFITITSPQDLQLAGAAPRTRFLFCSFMLV